MTTRPHLTVGPSDGDITGDTNAAIQAAVDRVAALGGGVVELLPGTYEMHDSLHLRSHVTVRGHGAATVLRKAPSVQSAIPAFLGYGHYDISVAEPEKFRTGMGVLVHDDHSMGFYDTVGTLTWQDGDRFGISRMLNHDYHVDNHATVTSVFPVVSACELTHATLEDVAIDGNRAQNHYLNGCRGGGVFLIQAHDVAIRHVTVKDFNGDGISFQQCVRTTIEDCQLLGNAGHGLHPGSGSVAPVMRRCRCSGNGDDGIFYCLRVTYSLCEDCEIDGSGHDGISIGERDSHHLIRNNTICRSGRHGIFFRQAVPTYGGNDNVIEDNRLFDNCRKDGSAEIFVTRGISRVRIAGNSFGPSPCATTGIYVEEGCTEIVVTDNRVTPGEAARFLLAGGATVGTEGDSLAVGPQAVPPGGALHLNVKA